MLFVETETADSRVNIFLKGIDSLKVVGSNRPVWLNVTGSDNETEVHIQESNRMTIMFITFCGEPMILRIYGKATVVHKNDLEWERLFSLF